VGGGGNPNGVLTPVAQGYAAGATDTGHEGGSGSFALDATGHLNWMLIRDNAYLGILGIHEMTLTAKALVGAFYGGAPRYSYFNGCSTGGRQGLMEAQRYPTDYNGILAGAPAINWTKLHVEQMWGHVRRRRPGSRRSS
jgi:feruloyl esterase